MIKMKNLLKNLKSIEPDYPAHPFKMKKYVKDLINHIHNSLNPYIFTFLISLLDSKFKSI